MNDTERLDLLVKVLQRHTLYQCVYGYTFFPKLSTEESTIPEAKTLIEIFFPTVRELLDAVAALNLKEYK